MFETPNEMDAWVLRPDRHGPPSSSLRRERVPVPVPGDGEVLVRVMAAGLNYSGVWAALGKPVSPFEWHGQKFHIPGTDGAGVVWKVGAKVRDFRAGDEVVLQPNVKCGECRICVRGDSDHCERFRVHGYETPGGTFAPFTLVKDYQLLRKPPHLSWEEAGSYLVCLMTAYQMLVARAELKAGDDVLLWGAAGGMGVYGVQLCKLFGARAIGIVSSAERAELVKKLGAIATFDRTEHPELFDVHKETGAARQKRLALVKRFRDRIREVLGGKDADVVFEHPGEATFFSSVFLAAPEGRIVISGATTGTDLTFDARYLWLARKTILGAHSATLDQCRRAHQLVADKKIDVVLTETFDYDQVAQANQRMFEGKISGNVACRIGTA